MQGSVNIHPDDALHASGTLIGSAKTAVLTVEIKDARAYVSTDDDAVESRYIFRPLRINIFADHPDNLIALGREIQAEGMRLLKEKEDSQRGN